MTTREIFWYASGMFIGLNIPNQFAEFTKALMIATIVFVVVVILRWIFTGKWEDG